MKEISTRTINLPKIAITVLVKLFTKLRETRKEGIISTLVW